MPASSSRSFLIQSVLRDQRLRPAGSPALQTSSSDPQLCLHASDQSQEAGVRRLRAGSAPAVRTHQRSPQLQGRRRAGVLCLAAEEPRNQN